MSNSRGSLFLCVGVIIAVVSGLFVVAKDDGQNERINALKERVAALEAARAPKQPVEAAEAYPPAPPVAPVLSNDGPPLVGDVIPTETNAIETVNGDRCWTLDGAAFVVEKIDGDWALIRYDRQGPPSKGSHDCPNGAYAVRQVSSLEFDKKRARERQEWRDAIRRLAPK